MERKGNYRMLKFVNDFYILRLRPQKNHTYLDDDMDELDLHLDDDPETLRVALAMIDAAIETHTDEDADSAESVDGVQVRSSTHTDELRKPSKRKRTPRDDIVQLRATFVELQSKLMRLRSQSDQMGLPSFFMKQTSTWKDVAVEQKKRRREAEIENEQLQAVLRSQMMVGQRLLLQLQQSEAKKAASATNSRRVQPIQSREEQDRHANALFAHLDVVFGKGSFQSGRSSFYDIRVHSKSKNESSLDTHAGWVVLCAAAQVAEVVWTNMTLIEGSQICQSLQMDIEAQGHTLLTSFTATPGFSSDRVYGDCQGTSLYRRYDTDDGAVVIVSVMSGKILDTTSTLHEDITIYEEQVMRIRPIEGLEDQTQVHIHRQIRFSFSTDHSSARQRIINSNIELMLLKVEDDITRKQEMVETLLQTQ
ncbi:hypothetical protein Poli38472_004925 [Pythium oligandrum]|uniref:Uncharacterized protein n=1 Tax=Pythium oligandrum TaxID=41045 RepID=A0A8K1CAQ9_PYTOL|nr:hypothetical protein Poli38472_004925 [Pythium oligandrum]|eukprot:TMW59856.1 hypothetical protein Poli38472_004925 [Pythium oligandrum]